VRVIDGDTIAMAADIWPGLTQQATVRVFRVDTPELRASQQCEKELAAKAAEFTKNFLADTQIWIRPNAFDSFGRALADVQADGKDLGQVLTNVGLARPYKVGVDGGWCDGP
jgi:endonuclease YncB( thermonuclease family)